MESRPTDEDTDSLTDRFLVPDPMLPRAVDKGHILRGTARRVKASFRRFRDLVHRRPLAATITPAQTRDVRHAALMLRLQHRPPEPALMSVATAASQTATPTATETDPANPRLDAGLPAAAGQNHHLPQRLVPQLPRTALGLEQHPPTGADRERLARGRAGVGVAARGSRYRRVRVGHHGRPADDVCAHARGDLCRRHRRAAPGQADLRALFRRAEAAQAAYLDVGDEVVHRHARRHFDRGRQDRSAGAGHGLCAGAEGQRVRRRAGARGDGYDHGPRIHGSLYRQEFRRVRAAARQRHGADRAGL